MQFVNSSNSSLVLVIRIVHGEKMTDLTSSRRNTSLWLYKLCTIRSNKRVTCREKRNDT
jgi:hypothetical protein